MASQMNSLQQLHDLLVDCFDYINDRPCVLLQPYETLVLLLEEYFYGFIQLILQEIFSLDGEVSIREKEDHLAVDKAASSSHSKEIQLKVSVVNSLRSRDYYLSFELTAESLQDFNYRLEVFYEILFDLMACRLSTGKKLQNRLAFSFSREDYLSGFYKVIKNIHDQVSPSSLSYSEKEETQRTEKNIPTEEALIQQLKTLTLIFKDPHYTPPPLPSHWIFQDFPKFPPHLEALMAIITQLNREYALRQSLLLRRFDISIQCFLQSSLAKANESLLYDVLISLVKWKCKQYSHGIYVWDICTADTSLFNFERISSKFSVASAVKKVTIGELKNRGGIPEGYSMKDVRNDVRKANFSLSKNSQSGKNFFGNSMRTSPSEEKSFVHSPAISSRGGRSDFDRFLNAQNNTPAGRTNSSSSYSQSSYGRQRRGESGGYSGGRMHGRGRRQER
ncbi:hypothetical protein IE077_002981 [Cardiosporidium cionae]|uniref:Uncharacterized protein n=1 Tax=Cardiosporidium cionae TaxID=476202 RepID=A0ABQ7J9H1_9APIC|nr:hypothetical protein IE077_002981 [Cardiosporidium cionae]|eukprot:KAF8820637.1 hypothetical protein IE077_002981 [Cardiosporidium cionae]